MGVNSLPKSVTRQRRGCDLNPGPTALESSTLTTRYTEPPLFKRTIRIPDEGAWVESSSHCPPDTTRQCCLCHVKR